MIGIIQDWLLSQLAINFNINSIASNNIFQDGRVFADILQKYGLLDHKYNLNIIPNKDPEQCKANLKLLKPIFDLLGVDYNETVTKGIVENNSSVILKLLYELYVCLENKQHLYFIKQQNYDRVQKNLIQGLEEKNISASIVKLDYKSELNCFEKPLIQNRDIVDWYKMKYKVIKKDLDEKLQKVKEGFCLEEVNTCKYDEKPRFCPCACDTKEDKCFLPDLDTFIKYDNEDTLLSYDQFIALFKKKLQHDESKKSIQNNIQNDLLSETWNKIMAKEKEIYNSVFSEILLKQSQYEKQLVSKLIQTQSQIKIQNENNVQVQMNLLNEQENQLARDFKFKEDFEALKNMYKNEQNRVLELHKKLYKEKKDLIKQRNFSLCCDVVDALVDLAINTSEYNSNYGVPVPKNLWNDWMHLFVQSQPIHTPFQLMENDIIDGKTIKYDEVINFERELDGVLNENDVDEYLFTYGRWFYEDVGLEHEILNENCLAFIVYRLLSLKYPLPPSPLPADLKPFKLAGVLIDVYNADCIDKLRILLSKPCVHVFDTEMAIKRSIDTFLKESAPPVEEKIKGKGNKIPKNDVAKNKVKDKADKKSAKKGKENKKGKKESKLPTEDNAVKLINLTDKETQTSVIKVEEDKEPIRTTMGMIGEKVSYQLKSGVPIDDDLLTSVIIEYLKTLEDCEGWLLLNYPLTINQAFTIELALTGKYLPINDYVIEKNEEVQESQDEFVEQRKSKLLSCPISDNDSALFKTYFSFFIKAKESVKASELQLFTPKDSSLSINGNEFEQTDMQNDLELEILPTNILEMLYKDQEIYKDFIYDSFDITTIKKLARIILNDDGIEATNSIDLFGEEFLNKLTKSKQKDQKKKKSLPNKKQKLGEKEKKKGRKSNNNSELLELNAEDITLTDKEGNNLDNIDIKTETTAEFDLQSKTINPGEKDWQYISLPINNQIAVLLATQWENIENCYLNNLLDIFFENRMISLRLVPYSTYVQEEVKTVMNKDDLKQNVVDVFQNYYNSIDRHLRELPDVKSQLHCKVLEMQQNLWELADDKKEETESKRQEVIFQNWLVTQLCMLINNYLSFVQTELTRSIETMKLINDYYLSMLNRDLPSNINLQSLNLDITKITEEALLLLQNESTGSIMLKNNSLMSSSIYSHSMKENKNNFVAQSLIYCSEKEDILKLIRVHINQEIIKAMNILTSTSTIFYNQIKMEENLLVSANKKLAKENRSTKTNNTPKESSEKKREMSSIARPNGKDEFKKSGLEGELLLLEWKFVIDTEINRFNFRMDLIEARANEDIMEFYCYLESVFCDLHSLILSRYSTDVQNINDLCEYIRFAIEEEITLNLPLVLSRKSFFINIIKGLKTELVPEVKELYEESSDFSFTINQLKLLLHIFKIAGPNGIIRKQPFCYIIQDLMLFNTGDHQPHLPKMWSKLSESQLIFLIDHMFGPEFAIDWRDFIIYNLDIDYPSISDILSMRGQFSVFDPDNTEVVSLESFATVKLWFENHLPGSPHEGLRIMLIKELLVDMFRVDDNNINYTALLLYFCKDFDPNLGLRKALSLSLGKNVIISTEEVRELLKNEEEIKDAVHSLLSNIIASIILNREGVVINEITDTESETNVSIDELIENYTISSPQSSVVSSDKSSTQSNISQNGAQSAKNSSAQPILVNSKQVHDEKSWTSRIPVSTVISVFNASFLNQDKNYLLRNIYLNCLEDEADDDHMIEAPTLVNLRCIQKIFALTNKFKISLPQKIFELLNKTDF